MKTITLPVILVSIMLTACGTLPDFQPAKTAPAPRTQERDMRPEVFREELARAADLIAARKITRAEGAERINAHRIALFGRDRIDDEVFEHYRELAARRDRNTISQAEAQSQMLRKIRDTRRKYGAQAKGPATAVLEDILK